MTDIYANRRPLPIINPSSCRQDASCICADSTSKVDPRPMICCYNTQQKHTNNVNTVVGCRVSNIYANMRPVLMNTEPQQQQIKGCHHHQSTNDASWRPKVINCLESCSQQLQYFVLFKSKSRFGSKGLARTTLRPIAAVRPKRPRKNLSALETPFLSFSHCSESNPATLSISNRCSIV